MFVQRFARAAPPGHAERCRRQAGSKRSGALSQAFQRLRAGFAGSFRGSLQPFGTLRQTSEQRHISVASSVQRGYRLIAGDASANLCVAGLLAVGVISASSELNHPMQLAFLQVAA